MAAKTGDMLNLSDLVRETGFPRSTLLRFLNYPAVRRWLGGEKTHPNYPADRLDLFRYMLQQHQRGIKPGPFSISIESIDKPDAPNSPNAAEGDIVPSSIPEGPQVPMPPVVPVASVASVPALYDPAILSAASEVAGTGFARVLIRELRDSNILPIVPDHIMDRGEVAAMLKCKESAVSRHVRPVRPGAWSYLHVQHHLADLRAKAEAKPPRPSRPPRPRKNTEATPQ